MTIEEKAKAYDEAIERAKEINREHSKNGFKPSDDVLYIFPSLKESKDERIKEAIVWCIDTIQGELGINEPEGLSISELKFWLEKLGEQKPNYCHHEVDLSGCSEEYRKAYYDGWNNCNQQHAQLEAEQKSIEVRTTGYWHVEDVEQKPWSKEDEDAIGMAIIALEDMYDEDAPNTTYGGYNLPFKKAAERLKSLKERVGCEVNCTTTWKPNESQMKWLHDAIESTQYEPRKQALISLYSDLMKLREE